MNCDIAMQDLTLRSSWARGHVAKQDLTPAALCTFCQSHLSVEIRSSESAWTLASVAAGAAQLGLILERSGAERIAGGGQVLRCDIAIQDLTQYCCFS